MEQKYGTKKSSQEFFPKLERQLLNMSLKGKEAIATIIVFYLISNILVS